MSDKLEAYKSFIHHMWIKNCDERQEWSQPVLSREEYERRMVLFWKIRSG